MEIGKRLCDWCGAGLTGRSDAKFCSMNCRTYSWKKNKRIERKNAKLNQSSEG